MMVTYLVVFVPCSCLFTFALLYLQRHDRLSRKDWLPWLVAYLLILLLPTVGWLASGQSLLSDSREIRWAEIAEQEQLSHWLKRLRIEEAQRQMQAHPEWSNDTIAEHCGFGSRSYFQTVFRKQTGMTPTAFMENVRGKRGNER